MDPFPAIIDRIREHAGAPVVGIYKLGSLAHGGFDPFVSDVDIAVLLENPVVGGSIAAAGRLKELCSGLPLSERYSFFVATIGELNRGLEKTRFTPFDVLDLLRHGELIAGKGVDLKKIRTPPHEELVSASAEFAFNQVLSRHFPESFLNPVALFEADYVWFTKFLLFPARFLYTLSHPEPVDNYAAVSLYVRNFRDETAPLVEAALLWRKKKPELAEVEKIQPARIALLYRNFLLAYAERLTGKTRKEALRWIEKLRSLQ